MTGPEDARRDLAEILADGRVEMSEAQVRMGERGHPAGRIDRARRRLAVETIREGAPGTKQRFYWQLPTVCPTCVRPYGLDTGSTSANWFTDRASNGDYWAGTDAPIEPSSVHEVPQIDAPPVAPLEPSGPPRCDRCGMAAAGARGTPCPYWPSGKRCFGTLR